MGPAPSVLVTHQTKTPVVFDWRCGGGGLSDRVDFSDGVSQFTKVIADSIVIRKPLRGFVMRASFGAQSTVQLNLYIHHTDLQTSLS